MDKYQEVIDGLNHLAQTINNRWGQHPEADIARRGAKTIQELLAPTTSTKTTPNAKKGN